MKKVLILGANGSLAKVATQYLLDNTDARLTLFLRNSYRLNNMHPDRIHIINGDVMDLETLKYAMEGQDVVYANLSGDMETQAEIIIKAMHQTRLKRLIFISSMGIYGEVPGEKYRSILNPYRDSAIMIESSDLDYTVVRPGWFTNENIIDYKITLKGNPFEGHDVSRKNIADLIMQLIETPDLYIRESVGISQI